MNRRIENPQPFSQTDAATYLRDYWTRNEFPFDEEDIQKVVTEAFASPNKAARLLVNFAAATRVAQYKRHLNLSEIMLDPTRLREHYTDVVKKSFSSDKDKVTDVEIARIVDRLMNKVVDHPNMYARMAVRNHQLDARRAKARAERRKAAAAEAEIRETPIRERDRAEYLARKKAEKDERDVAFTEFLRLSVEILSDIRESQVKQLDMVRLRFFEEEDLAGEIEKLFPGTTWAARDQWVTRGLRLLEDRGASQQLMQWFEKQKKAMKVDRASTQGGAPNKEQGR